MKKIFAVLALAALAGSGMPAGAQSAPYTFQVIMPMTGQAAFSGQAESQSLAAYEKYVNANGGVRGTPIHFDIHDDQTSPQVALQLANAATAQHVPVIFGSSVVATCASIGAAVAATGPVQFCLSPGFSPPKDSYAFATGTTILALTRTILLYAKLRGFHRVAFIGSTDATGIASAAVNAQLFKEPGLSGLEQVADERVTTGDVTADAQMAKIKAAKPDVVWTSTSGTVFATVMHSMSNVGLDVPVLTTTANANAPQLKQLNAFLPRELYFNGVPFQLGDQLRDAELKRQTKIFADAFKGIGVEATPLHALAWDPLLITVAALRQFGPTMTADQLKSYVLGLRHFTGLNGNYDFSSGDQHGLDSNAVVIVGWDRDKQDFFPASQTGGTPIKR
ncbi:MAG TPA: ABC transporter substrate-binding protein [Candidatus Lustribacter sp.]|nr:ABC transporter substrate-binding protein [Candidatus Lustribacter sp.]